MRNVNTYLHLAAFCTTNYLHMIYTTKIKIARLLEKSRPKIDKMIEEGTIKVVKNDNDEKLWYVIVKEFIAYLVN